ncbi:MAG: hypothetical protein CM15mP121_2420 [Bacteroidota bacterium]|nr:MAG: hypothetical protein CM15mP121_2420 [Bacteroidota bacterium]
MFLFLRNFFRIVFWEIFVLSDEIIGRLISANLKCPLSLIILFLKILFLEHRIQFYYHLKSEFLKNLNSVFCIKFLNSHIPPLAVTITE